MRFNLLDLLKKVPIDFGQGSLRHRTEGKRIAFGFVGDGEGRRALDLGSGDGYWTDKLKTKGWQVASVDREKCRQDTIIVNAEKPLALSDNYFDLVWCSEVIEHIANIRTILSEIRRVVKPGGLIIITTPNSYFWLYKLLGIFGLTPKRLQNLDHKHFFSYADIRGMFPSADILGYFPYAVLKLKIRKFAGLLSPTFVVIQHNVKQQ